MTFVFTVTLYGCGWDTKLFRPRVWTFADYEPAYLHFLDMYDTMEGSLCENKFAKHFRNQRYDPKDETSQEDEIVIEERTETMGTGPMGENLERGWTSWGIIITRSVTR